MKWKRLIFNATMLLFALHVMADENSLSEFQPTEGQEFMEASDTIGTE